MNNGSSIEQQVALVLRMLEARKGLSTDSPVFQKALDWIRYFPGGHELRAKVTQATCRSFEISEAQLIFLLEGKEKPPTARQQDAISEDESTFNKIILPGGWLETYAEVTRYNEAPMSFHLACGFGALGAAVGRKCWVDMGGVFRIHGNTSVLLIGPTGKVKKSTAIDFAGDLIRDSSCCNLISGKFTAEALGTELSKSSRVCAQIPELSLSLGKQKYNEGLIPLLLKLLDNRPSIEIRTQARGTEVVENPSFSLLGGSTMSLLNSSTADEVLSGGFLNRMMTVIENGSSRVFPIPWLGEGIALLKETLDRIKNYDGAIGLSKPAMELYQRAYIRRKRDIQASSDQLAEVMQRGSDHWLRLGMLTHLAECGYGDICASCLQFAMSFVAILESKMPEMVKQMDRTQASADCDYVLGMLTKLGGAADHSSLLRRVGNRMNSRQFKSVVQTLEEQGMLIVSKKGTGTYYLVTGDREDGD